MRVLSASFWSWPGWGVLSSLGTLATALVALQVYLAEVSRRRRADRDAVRVWVTDDDGLTEVHIVNDSKFPIVDTTIVALYEQSYWAATLGGMNWAAVGWIARGPHVVHPSQSALLTLSHFYLGALDNNLPKPALVRLEYEASTESRVASFTRIKKHPKRVRIVDCGYLERYERQAVNDARGTIPAPSPGRSDSGSQLPSPLSSRP
ncbi:hypothetical protein GCM10012279_25000 [Micromonospora yangpuensis]|nr:hypothetical protein GCM10012279_25000 [Micromonospora yangpuensis]